MNNDVKILNSTTDFNAYFNTISISEDIKLDNVLSISNGCSATINVPAGVVIDTSNSGNKFAFNVNTC